MPAVVVVVVVVARHKPLPNAMIDFGYVGGCECHVDHHNLG